MTSKNEVRAGFAGAVLTALNGSSSNFLNSDCSEVPTNPGQSENVSTNFSLFKEKNSKAVNPTNQAAHPNQYSRNPESQQHTDLEKELFKQWLNEFLKMRHTRPTVSHSTQTEVSEFEESPTDATSAEECSLVEQEWTKNTVYLFGTEASSNDLEQVTKSSIRDLASVRNLESVMDFLNDIECEGFNEFLKSHYYSGFKEMGDITSYRERYMQFYESHPRRIAMTFDEDKKLGSIFFRSQKKNEPGGRILSATYNFADNPPSMISAEQVEAPDAQKLKRILKVLDEVELFQMKGGA
eukprot:GHVP01067436.1.p1 GENE.GHVP01067436.1~~GHVP01067436.1.p1  ORF type:complete len:303 (+),score=52.72 GHVP01067436.1:23-910(+)